MADKILVRDFFQKMLAKPPPQKRNTPRTKQHVSSISSASSSGSQRSDASDGSPIEEESKSKLIGQGSYGCVYHPGLKCKPGVGSGDELNTKFADNPHYIMKIMSDAAARQEQTIANYVIEIPESERFFTTIIAPPCQIERVEKTLERRCSAYKSASKKEQSTFKGYYMRYRGPELERAWPLLAADVRSRQAVVFFARHLCDGLSRLHMVDITHFDIKPANALLAPNRELDSPVTFIDFGLAVKWPEESAPLEDKLNLINRLLQISGQYYPPYPPDFQAFTRLLGMGDLKFTTAAQLQNDIAQNSQRKDDWNPLVQSIGSNEEEQAKSMRTRWLPFWKIQLNSLFGRQSQLDWQRDVLTMEQSRLQYQLIQRYFKSLDVYSLGVLIYFMLYWSSVPGKGELDIYASIRGIVLQMCDLNYIKRLTATDARIAFERLLTR